MSGIGIAGRWAGNLVFDNAVRFVVAEFQPEGSDIAGTLDGSEIQHITTEGAHVRFGLSDHTQVEAHIDGDVLTGSAVRSDQSGTLALARIVWVDPLTYDEIAGTYHLTENHVITVSHIGDYLYYYDSAKQQTGLLFPSS